jgi:hypothetical protein
MVNTKIGDTLSFIVRRLNEDGTPRTGEGLKLKSQIRAQKGELIGEFIITETSVLGDYLFEIDKVQEVSPERAAQLRAQLNAFMKG